MHSEDPSGYDVEAPVDLARVVVATPRIRTPGPAPAEPSNLEWAPALRRLSMTSAPAEWGWRGRVRRWTAGLVNPAPGPEEAQHRQARLAVQQHLGGTRLVMVANIKGGSMVTTTALMLAHVFAELRGGSVVAWDTNESHGTLAYRAETANPDTHVWHLLAAFDRLASSRATAGDINHYLRSQPSRADVLASDTEPQRLEQIGAAECGRIGFLLGRQFRLTVMDTGNNLRAPNWQWAAGLAHQLVVPIRADPDTAQSAVWMLDALARRRPDLVTGAVVVLGPTASPTAGDLRDEMVSYFSRRCTAIVEVPFDPQLAGGHPIVYARITQKSHRAWVSAAAAVADRLAAMRTIRPDQESTPTGTEPTPAVDQADGTDATIADRRMRRTSER